MSDGHEIDLTGRPMVVFGSPERDTSRATASVPRRPRWALLVACATALVLAIWVWVDHRRTGPEREAVAAVTAYVDGFNAHSGEAVRAAMAPRGGFGAGDIMRRPLITAAVGPELDRLLGAVFAAGATMEATGRMEVAPDAQHVTVPQRMRYHVYGVDVVEEGVSLFTLIEIDGEPKVAEHFWWRPYPARAPSMLWATNP